MSDNVVDEDASWSKGKKLTALLATAGALVGLATGVLTLWDRIFPNEEAPEQQRVISTPAERKLSPEIISQLSDGVQLSRFEELLGPPLGRQRLSGGSEYEQSIWTSPDVAVVAYSDIREQVTAYTITALSPNFTPLVELVRGGVRLRSSVFADIDDEPQNVTGVYPLNGQWSYLELYGGGYATGYKQVILAASWTANTKDSVATELTELSCLPYSLFEPQAGCEPSQLRPLRTGLHITSMTVGEPDALKTLEGEGALFFADAEATE